MTIFSYKNTDLQSLDFWSNFLGPVLSHSGYHLIYYLLHLDERYSRKSEECYTLVKEQSYKVFNCYKSRNENCK